MSRKSLTKARWTMAGPCKDGTHRLVFTGDEGEIEITMSLYDIGILQGVTSHLLYAAACPDLEQIRAKRWEDEQASSA